MSMVALLVAVRDTLRSTLQLDNQTCRITARGPKPPPGCGDRFIAVFGLDWNPIDYYSNLAIDETYSVACGITYRAPYVPYDNEGEQLYVEAAESIESLARQIMATVHQNYDPILKQANAYLTAKGSTYNIFEPLRWQTTDAQPTPVGPDWFMASRGKSESGGDEVAGLVMQVNFSGARRKQPTGSIL